MASLLRRMNQISWTGALTMERQAAMSSVAAMDTRRRSFGTNVKVILTDDVVGTGYRGEYVEVKGGFMRNYLFPNRRAMYATEDNKISYESLDRTAERERAAALKMMKRGRQEMASIPIIVKRHLPPGVARLEQAVTAKHVWGYLQKNWQFKGTQEDVRMLNGSPIVSLGEHTVLVRMPLSEAASAILLEELGAKEFERQASVEMTVHVERANAKDDKKLRDEAEGEEEGVEGAEGEDEEETDIHGKSNDPI